MVFRRNDRNLSFTEDINELKHGKSRAAHTHTTMKEEELLIGEREGGGRTSEKTRE